MSRLTSMSWAVVAGAVAAIPAVAGIGDANSKHNLGASGSSQISGNSPLGGTTEVCVFCHTPHGSDTSAAAPLWNKNLTGLGGAGYQRYSDLGTATLDGKEATVGSVSIACRSCHDGTQAMDAVINAPGSGLGSFGTGTPGNEMTGSPVPMLGTDLRNDHPISIEYAGGACASATPGPCTPQTASTGDPDFQPADFASINGNPQWWVNTSIGGSANRQKTDMILYTRDAGDGNIVTAGPAVECASCHDPHNTASQPVQFLRIDNDNSDVCLACHIK